MMKNIGVMKKISAIHLTSDSARTSIQTVNFQKKLGQQNTRVSQPPHIVFIYQLIHEVIFQKQLHEQDI